MRVENGVLRIHRNCTLMCSSRGPRAVIDITTNALDRVAVGYGADASVQHVSARTFDANVSMGGDLTINGTYESLTAAASMGADLRATNLKCSNVRASASMGAEVYVFATQSVAAHAGMGADVHIAGEPAQRDIHGGLGGDVTIE